MDRVRAALRSLYGRGADRARGGSRPTGTASARDDRDDRGARRSGRVDAEARREIVSGVAFVSSAVDEVPRKVLLQLGIQSMQCVRL